MLWITPLVSIAALLADYLFYRYRVRYWPSALRRRFFTAFAVATDLLPCVVSLAFLVSPDNGTGLMLFAQWTFFAFLVTVLPRQVWYLFRWLHLPHVGILLGAVVVLLLVWGTTAGRTSFRLNRVTIRSERLPAAFDGFRIAQFSDTHIGTMIRPERELQRLVDAINALHPDLVVFSGDLVNIRYTELDTAAMRILGGLHAPFGVVSSIGNHDIGTYVKDSVALPAAENRSRLIERQQAMGWRVLDDASEFLVRGNDSISLSAISFDPALRQFRHSFDLPEVDLSAVYAGVPDTLCNITVSHLPQLWPNIRSLGYGDLTLAGHVHSMQMKLRLGSWRFSPAQWMYKRWSGLYGEQGGYLYINDGIGCVGFPMRLGAYPEITLFTLER